MLCVIVASFLATWMAVIDPYSYLAWRKLLAGTRALERQKSYYLEKIAGDRQKIRELQGDRASLEKFAREQYLMKRPDEDLFIITGD